MKINSIVIIFHIGLFLLDCSGCSKSGKIRKISSDEVITDSQIKIQIERRPNISKSIKFEINDIISGKIISVLDGDTYDILTQNEGSVRIRMQGIDAPERGMPFYNVAKKHLSSLCLYKLVSVKVDTIDTSGDSIRYIGYSILEDKTELGHEMIKAGLAWHFKKYNSNPELARLEIKARKAKIGLWIDDQPMAPWDNRRYHKNGISTKDSFNIKVGKN